jgi:hypothetical protein
MCATELFRQRPNFSVDLAEIYLPEVGNTARESCIPAIHSPAVNWEESEMFQGNILQDKRRHLHAGKIKPALKTRFRIGSDSKHISWE